jgi:hypothetical protein
MLKNYKITDIYSVPIIKIKFKQHKKYKFEDIEKKERYPGHWQIPLNTTFPNIIQSDEFIDLETISNLKCDIKKSIDKVLKKLNYPTNYYFHDFWYNIYHINQGQEPHNHLPSNEVELRNVYWSGIYYAKNSTPTTFHIPTSWITPILSEDIFALDEYERNKLYSHTVSPKVSDGEIVLFPAFLFHSVPLRKEKDQMRLTFAFNLQLQ